MLNLEKYKPQWLNIADINLENKQFQFRATITPASVAELAKSLKEEGQKFPVVVWQRTTGEKQLISGFRRAASAKQLGWDKILAITIPEGDLPETEALKFNFIENLQRKTLTNLDFLQAVVKLSSQGKSERDIAKLIEKSKTAINRYLKLASSPIINDVLSGKLSLNKAYLQLGIGGFGVVHSGPPVDNLPAKVPVSQPLPAESMVTGGWKPVSGLDAGSAIDPKELAETLTNMYKGMKGPDGKPLDFGNLMSGMEEMQKAAQFVEALDKARKENPIPNDRIYLKPAEEGGFDLIVKYRSAKDDITKVLDFIESTLAKLKGQ